MVRLLIAVILTLTSASAVAFQWPWQDPPEPRLEYCRGFLATGLGALPVEGLSRIQLWLAWNEVVKLTPTAFDIEDQQYLEGRSFFDSMQDSGNTQAIIDTADDTCAMGT